MVVGRREKGGTQTWTRDRINMSRNRLNKEYRKEYHEGCRMTVELAEGKGELES